MKTLIDDLDDLDAERKMSKKEMFSDANIGDKVWDYQLGWGNIVNLDFSDYPIIVDFPDGGNASYTLSGHEYMDDINPSLFWGEVSFEVPPKPPARLEVDDKVVVWNKCGVEYRRHFSHFDDDGIIWTFADGKTSFTYGEGLEWWHNWKLVEEE